MFVTNPDSIPTYSCGKKVAEYIISVGKIPVISKMGGEYYFSDTEKLRDIVNKMPLLLRLSDKYYKTFVRGGGYWH